MINNQPRLIGILCLLACIFSVHSQVTVETDSLLLKGQTNYSSKFFRERVLHNSFGSFVDNYNDYLIYQTTTHGDFHVPDQTVISIQGNSYRWNKYYLDGFRIDDRVTPGSSLYEQDLYKNSFTIDTYNSSFNYKRDSVIGNGFMVRYNHGDLGGISPGTEWFFNLFHSTALQTNMKPIDYRRHMNGQGVFVFDYNLKHKGELLPQSLYVDYGQRELVAFDYTTGNTPFYEDYLKAELQGALPTFAGIDHLNYALAFSTRDQFNHEFYYGENETARNDKFSLSLYGSKHLSGAKLVSGVSAVVHNINHNETNFSRNHMDMDGESLDPYYADTKTLELSHFLNYTKTLGQGLSINAETYNSFIHSTPNAKRMTSSLYFESLISPLDDSWLDEENPFYTSLYVYEWETEAFSSALLENRIAIDYQLATGKKIDIKANAALSLDGMLIDDKSLVRGNWEAELLMNWKPNTHFSMGLNIARKRIAFHYDMIKYLSDDYLSSDVYYWQDANEDRIYQAAERSTYLTSTGGEHRTLSGDIKQPAYFMIDWPIIVNVGRKHTFSMVTNYKKFYNQWQTTLAESADNYGNFETDGSQEIFFQSTGQTMDYLINSDRPDAMQLDQNNPFFTNTPFSLTNVMKYAYNSEKVFFSISWVSQFMMNVATLGNSPQENNVEMFSDAMANPNTQIKSVGRPQQDRGYVARLLYGYRFNDHWKASFLFKFIDGQPFAKYDTRLKTDENGNTQIATWRYLNNSISPLYEGWGDREDMGFNTELKLAYTFFLPLSSVELNLSGYNLIDFAYELTSNGFDVPMERRRTSTELCAPRGFMFTAKVSL